MKLSVAILRWSRKMTETLNVLIDDSGSRLPTVFDAVEEGNRPVVLSTSSTTAPLVGNLVMGASTVGIRAFPNVTGSQIIERAQSRIDWLQEMIGEGVTDEDGDEDEAQRPLSPFAVRKTLEVIRHLADWPSASDVAIFPLPEGGLHLQVVGAERTVSLAIPPDEGKSLLGEYASRSTYHREEFDKVSAAARFVAMSNQ
jgi:hypothetical protein